LQGYGIPVELDRCVRSKGTVEVNDVSTAHHFIIQFEACYRVIFKYKLIQVVSCKDSSNVNVVVILVRSIVSKVSHDKIVYLNILLRLHEVVEKGKETQRRKDLIELVNSDGSYGVSVLSGGGVIFKVYSKHRPIDFGEACGARYQAEACD